MELHEGIEELALKFIIPLRYYYTGATQIKCTHLYMQVMGTGMGFGWVGIGILF
jgi:hypothetical protein